MRRAFTIAAAAIAAGLTAGAPAEAGPPHCPPGHAKKGWCSSGGYRLPPGIEAKRWDDWERYGYRRPRRGESYRIVDGELFLILDATREVLEAIGAVERVLR